MQSEFQKIFQEIQADPDNESFTKQGIKPLYYASSSTRINIIGQADSLGDEFVSRYSAYLNSCLISS